MTGTFVSSRLESIEKRFQEVELLLTFADENKADEQKYATFCRSAHIILVAHFEGIIKELCKDAIDDLSYNCTFDMVPSKIFATYCSYFHIHNGKEFSDKSIHGLRLKLKEAFGNARPNLKVEPFLFAKDKNLAPAILESILEKYGGHKFFWSLKQSKLDVAFEDSKSEIDALRNLVIEHVNQNVLSYPYTVSRDVYDPDAAILTQQSSKTLWEEFIDDILKERHAIVHGQKLHNPYDHILLLKAKTKIEILIYVFIIELCSLCNPISDETES